MLESKNFSASTKGLYDTGQNEGMIDSGFALELQNARISVSDEVMKRRGRKRFNAVVFPGAPAIKTLMLFEGDVLENYEVLAIGNSEMRKYEASTGGFSRILKVGLSTTRRFSSTIFNGKLIVSNGVDNMVKYAFVAPPVAPTTGTAVSGALAARRYFVKTTYATPQIDQQHTAGDASVDMGHLAVATYMTQVFTPSVSRSIQKVSMRLQRVGNPVDNLQCEIRATANNVPTGAALTNVASIAMTSIKTEFGWYDFSFTTYAELTAETKYAIVLSRSGAVDSTNYIKMGVDAAEGYAGGLFHKSSDGISWVGYHGAGYDAHFQTFLLWGETRASLQTEQAVAANSVLTVTSPAASTGAVAYFVHASTASGLEKKQFTKPVAIGTNWTEPNGGLVDNGNLPVSNTAWYVTEIAFKFKYIFNLNHRTHGMGVPDEKTRWRACAVNAETDFTTASDSLDIDLTGSIAKGDSIRGINRHGPTNELLIGLGNHIVSYDVPTVFADITIKNVIYNLGAMSHWGMTEVGSDTYVIDTSGVNALRREVLVQGLTTKRLSDAVKARIMPILAALADPEEITAINYKNENEYVISIPSQSRRYIYDYLHKRWAEDRGVAVYDMVTTPDGFLLSAGADGFVHREYMDENRIDLDADGNNDSDIAFRWDTPWLSFDNISQKKVLRYFRVKGTGFGRFTLKIYMDYSDTPNHTYYLQSFPAAWDTVKWDTSYFEFPDINNHLIPIIGRGMVIKLSFEATHKESLSISHYGLHYSRAGTRSAETRL